MMRSKTHGRFRITGVRHDLGAPEDFDGYMSWNVNLDDECDGRFKVVTRYVASDYADPIRTPNGFGEDIDLEVRREDLIGIGGGCIDARNAFLRSARMKDKGFDVHAGGGPDGHTNGKFFVAGQAHRPETRERVRIAGNMIWSAYAPGTFEGSEDDETHLVWMRPDGEWSSRSKGFFLAEEVDGNFVGRLAAGMRDARREITGMISRRLDNASIWAPPV